jgi:hypothetical protein
VLVVLGAVGLIGLARRAQAQIGEKLAGFGDELRHIAELHPHSAPRRLGVNGLEMNLVTLSTPLEVDAALDRLEANCGKHGGFVTPAALLAATESARPVYSLLHGVFRRETEQQGALACFDTGGKLDVSEVVDRLNAVHRDGDLSALGNFRYALARRGTHETTLLILWTEGHFPIAAAFPKVGDAPGRDPVGVPRAAGTRRLLAAAEYGAPYSVSIYEAGNRAPRKLLGWYDRELAGGGWAVNLDAKGVLTARRAGRVVTVITGATKDGVTTVSVVELS